MSRSYKKFPIVIQEKEDYRLSNRKLRHDKLAEIPDGGAYRRLKPHCSTWKEVWTREQAIQDYENLSRIREMYPDKQDFLNYWEKCTKRK
jgi:hypothetical protein